MGRGLTCVSQRQSPTPFGFQQEAFIRGPSEHSGRAEETRENATPLEANAQDDMGALKALESQVQSLTPLGMIPATGPLLVTLMCAALMTKNSADLVSYGHMRPTHHFWWHPLGLVPCL